MRRFPCPCRWRSRVCLSCELILLILRYFIFLKLKIKFLKEILGHLPVRWSGTFTPYLFELFFRHQSCKRVLKFTFFSNYSLSHFNITNQPFCAFKNKFYFKLFVFTFYFCTSACRLFLQTSSAICFNSGRFSLQPGLCDSFPIFKSLFVASLHDKSSFKWVHVSKENLVSESEKVFVERAWSEQVIFSHLFPDAAKTVHAKTKTTFENICIKVHPQSDPRTQ